MAYTLATSWEELTHWKRLWCWEGLEAGGEGDNRGWDDWMALPTRTWVWVNSEGWWWTGSPGMLRFMGSQRVRHDWETEMNWTELNWKRQKTCMQKTIRHWWKKPKTTQTDGEAYHVLGWEESILWKWPYYRKQCTDSMQSLSSYQWHFHIARNFFFTICIEIQKTLNNQRNLGGKKKMDLLKSTILTSDYITKLQSSR